MDTYAAAGARPAHTTLQSLAALLEGEGLLASTEHIDSHAATPISGVDCDSRVAAQNHLFVCKGAAFKPAYLLSAVEKGVVACLCDANLAPALREACPQLPMLVATDLRRAMALASAEAWGHPDRAINVLGITGTKGKSTVAYMLRHILDGKTAGSGTGIMGSIDTYDGIEDFESVNTTPESPDLWRHLANTRDAGLASMVMEVSSQALKYDRVTGLKLDVACFLNLGRDHISPVEHPSFEDYFESKLRIFDQAFKLASQICRCVPSRCQLLSNLFPSLGLFQVAHCFSFILQRLHILLALLLDNFQRLRRIGILPGLCYCFIGFDLVPKGFCLAIRC